MPITWDFSKSAIYKEGKAEGKSESKKEMAVAMLNAGKCSIEEISMISGLSREEVIAARNLNT